MNTPPDPATPLWPLAVYLGVVLILVAGMLGLSYALGERRRHSRPTGEPYESGIKPTGTARQRLSAKFYLVAMFFVVFDLEAVFLYSWAVAARELGWAGYLEVLIFSAVLVAVLIYLWRNGALDWAVTRRQPPGRRPDSTGAQQ